MPVSYIKVISLILLSACCLGAYSQTRIGAPYEAIGNAASTTGGIWSAWYNPAGISSQQQLSVAVSYRTIQLIEGFNTAGMAVVLPIKTGAFGLGISRFGDLLFNEQQISLSYGSKFGITDLGIRLGYHQYHFEGFGNKGVPVISFGGITTLSKEFLIGASIENINQGKISDFQDERIPVIMQVGISYRPLENISVNIDVQKDIEFDPSLLIGVSYGIIDNVTIKSGFNTNPFRQFFGLDFIPNNSKGMLSYGLSHQVVSGYAHQVSLQYDLKSRR